MNNQLMTETRNFRQSIRRRREIPFYRFPSVSIFMPFNPKMDKKNVLMNSLSGATKKTINELRDKYPGEMSELVIQKLKSIVKRLDFNTHKKSLAIFVSPVFEKVYYFSIEVKEKIIVNESFQIRDILFYKEKSRQYHILLLTNNESRIYLNASQSFIRIFHDAPESEGSGHGIFSGEESKPDEVSIRKELTIENNLHILSHSLEMVLSHDNQPVLVFGTDTLISQFKNIVKNRSAIFEYLTGNFETNSLNDLKELMNHDLVNCQRIRQKYLTQQLRNAIVTNKLSMGLDNVLREVSNYTGSRLLISKKYLQESGSLKTDDPNERWSARYSRFSNVKNPLDEIIEKVLMNDGDVEMIDEEILNEGDQIVLIKK